MRDAGLREFYDRTYHFGEDADRPNPDRLWRALRELGPLEGTRFLDLGCGVGWATRLAAERGQVAQAVGLDFSRTALALAARAPRAAPTADGRAGRTGPASVPIAWVCGDGLALPFPDDSFDRVFSFGSMEHFPDVAAGFGELARVLRRGGCAVTVVPNFYVRTAQPVEHRATARGWRTLIERAGLQVTRMTGDPGPAIFKNRRPGRIALRLGLRLVGSLPPLRYQFIVALRKP